MLAEVARFQREARRYLAAGGDEQPLGDFLTAGRYSAYFQAHYILPVVSAVWSAGPATARQYPTHYLFRFLDNHGMLAPRPSLRWRTIPGGSHRYVERLAKELSAVITCTPVRAVARHSDGVEVRDEADEMHLFDHVVIAAHADSTLEASCGSHTGGEIGPRRLHLLGQRCRPTYRLAAPPRPEVRPGLVELLAAQLRRRQPRRGRQLLHEPSARPPGTRRLLGEPQRP